MEDLAWRARPVFGIAHLDAQHEQLVQLMRQIRAALLCRRPVQELRRLAALLTLHTRMHFLDEEMFMEGAGYPGLDPHRRRHAEFTEGLLRLQSRSPATLWNQFAQIVEYELGWIHQHLEDEDDELGRWLKEHAVFAEGSSWEPDLGQQSHSDNADVSL